MVYTEIIDILKKEGLLVSYDNLSLSFSYISYNKYDINCDTLFFCLDNNLDFFKMVKEGVSCFVSLNKENVDLPFIIVNDIRKALALISNNFYKINNYRLVGVVGSNGKTTTLEFLRNSLNYVEHKDYQIFSFKDELEIVDFDRYLKNNSLKDIDIGLVELTKDDINLDKIYGHDFDIGVLTNISPYLDNDSFFAIINFLKSCYMIVLNKDMEGFDKVYSLLKGKYIITCGSNFSIYRLDNIRSSFDRVSFSLNYNDKDSNYKISIKGKYNIYNAILSIIAGFILGIDNNFKNSLEKVVLDYNMNIIDDYKCPVVIDKVSNRYGFLCFLKEIKDMYPFKNIKIVLGINYHNINKINDIGKIISNYANYIYLTTDNPGDYEVLKMCFDIAKEFKKNNISYEIIIDRKDAIKKCLEASDGEDIVLILGKGNEKYQFVKNNFFDYEGDIEVVREFINKK